MAKKDIAPVALMRARSRFKTSKAAWKAIADSTGLKPSDVKPAHTEKAWRWVQKTMADKLSAAKRKKAAKKKPATKKTAAKKKTTAKKKPAKKKPATKKTTAKKKTAKKKKRRTGGATDFLGI